MKKIDWKAKSEQLQNPKLAIAENQGTLDAVDLTDAAKQIVEIQEKSFGKAKKMTIVMLEQE